MIISPAGKLLDCSAVSVTFIAHDGNVGVMSNHMPMLCELGMGIMEIHLPHTQNLNSEKKYALIDGGFALVHSNMINVIANDAVSGWDIKKEKIDILIENGKKKLKSVPENSEIYIHQTRKNILLKKLVSAAG